jgi:hypothetical protein
MRIPCILVAIAAAMGAARGAVVAQTPSADIHYVPTPDAVVSAMLEVAQVGPADVVYDLGSGDGRIVIEAARSRRSRRGHRARSRLEQKALKNARKAGVADKVSFVRADFFKTDLSRRLSSLYSFHPTSMRGWSQLRRELKPGARIVSHRFPMPPAWKPDRDLAIKGTHVFLWTIR